jgi:hypothetical protein
MVKMKKWLLGVLILTVLAFAASAFAEGEVKWKTYTDKNFGFSVEYPDLPDIFNAGEEPYTDGDGVSHFTRSSRADAGDGRFMFDIYGGKNADKATAQSKLKDWTNMDEDEFGYVYGVEPLPGTAKAGDGYFTLDYADDSAGEGCVKHVYGIVTKTRIAVYELRYPEEEAEMFAEIAEHMDKSLKVEK